MPIPKSFGWVPSLPDFRDYQFSAPRVVLESAPVATDLSIPLLPIPWGAPYDQLALGSCGPHSAAADLAFAMLGQEGDQTGPMPSRLFIYWCARYLMGTVNSDSGVDNRSMLKALNKFGWCDESLWPYDIGRFRERPPDVCFEQAATRKIETYQAVPQNLEQMMGCIAGGDPFIFGFGVWDNIHESDHTGLIPIPTRANSQIGGHDILFVGYNNDSVTRLGIPPRHFKLRNSWSPRWGVGGYGFIPFEYAANPGMAGDFWTVKKSAYVPPAPPPPKPEPVPEPPAPEPSPDAGGLVMGILAWVRSALLIAQQAAKLTQTAADDKIIAGLIELIDLYMAGSGGQEAASQIAAKMFN